LDTPFDIFIGWRTFNIISNLGVFLHNAKAFSTTRIAGGLFVLLREQGLALTIKTPSHKT
jgi:hypothetical protein